MKKIILATFAVFFLLGCNEKEHVKVYDVYKVTDEEKIQTSIFLLGEDFFSLVNNAATVGELNITKEIKEEDGKEYIIFKGEKGRTIDKFEITKKGFQVVQYKQNPENEIAFKIEYIERK